MKMQFYQNLLKTGFALERQDREGKLDWLVGIWKLETDQPSVGNC